MPYYVAVGSRGIILRFGSFLTETFGAVTYWRAVRRRTLQPSLAMTLREPREG